MPKVYLSIGTNLGDRHANLQTAVDKLAQLYPVLSVSKIYETQPVGEVVQDDFYNIALALEVPESLKPEVLLTQTQQIEKDMKRVKTIHWGPRTIDLDILLFGDVRLVSEQLTIPHAEMANRRFVLQPLLEVAEQISDVAVVKETQALLAKTADQNWVQPTTYTITYTHLTA
ncbi:2-amino-4-hydroxy-6-hydroxymethyldihydropteridine diphosphokinase [Bacilli bacterium]|nr:2-amino-4-hydroxy-6-hydroxymethyldihydropteridine diphosphokinase [Bacilli bacterium]GHU40681.1 2-amino-4-hydroxy-6-hydroxymethyldihydropteridine diphosphokinase [Bacilli bacterium]